MAEQTFWKISFFYVCIFAFSLKAFLSAEALELEMEVN